MSEFDWTAYRFCIYSTQSTKRMKNHATSHKQDKSYIVLQIFYRKKNLFADLMFQINFCIVEVIYKMDFTLHWKDVLFLENKEKSRNLFMANFRNGTFYNDSYLPKQAIGFLFAKFLITSIRHFFSCRIVFYNSISLFNVLNYV